MEKAYVGVTGITSVEEIRAVDSAFRESGLVTSSVHKPMMGFLASYKTLELGLNPGNLRYPRLEDLARLLEEAKGKAFVTIHYNTRNVGALVEEVSALLDNEAIFDRGLCNGLQLNVTWPSPKSIEEIRQEYPQLKIILSITSGAMDRDGKKVSHKEIANSALAYDGIVNYILIDPSGGKSAELDVNRAAGIYYELLETMPTRKAVAFAGGLSSESVARIVGGLWDALYTRDFSIDAEGALRDKITQDYGNDTLNAQKVASYLKEAARAFS